jgi:hypothetical protein
VWLHHKRGGEKHWSTLVLLLNFVKVTTKELKTLHLVREMSELEIPDQTTTTVIRNWTAKDS